MCRSSRDDFVCNLGFKKSYKVVIKKIIKNRYDLSEVGYWIPGCNQIGLNGSK